MLTGTGLMLFLIVAVLLVGLFWRVDRAVEDEDTDDGPEDDETDRIVTQVAAAQRLRREAAATTDPEERARLVKLADEADGTAEKIREGVLSDN